MSVFGRMRPACSSVSILRRGLRSICEQFPEKLEKMLLIGTEDVYGGVKLKSSVLDSEVKREFAKHLKESLESWTEMSKRGIWFHVDIGDSELIPILVQNGFVFHHAQTNFVVMTKWIPTTENTLPKYAHTTIGVGGLVVDANGRILLMREMKGHYLGWKFPGGLSEPNENLFTTAAREVFEETGVKAVAKSILLFRQIAASQFKNVGDIYFVCAMELENKDEHKVVPCPHETAEAKWFTRSEIAEIESAKLHSFHTTVLDLYDNWVKSGRKGCHRVDFANLRGHHVDLFQVD